MTELDHIAFDEAIKGEHPAVIDFWAGWCMPCKIFAPVLEDVADELDGKADFYKLNIDDYSAIATKYGIASIPTVIVFKAGEELERMVGVRAKDEVLDMVQRHL